MGKSGRRNCIAKLWRLLEENVTFICGQNDNRRSCIASNFHIDQSCEIENLLWGGTRKTEKDNYYKKFLKYIKQIHIYYFKIMKLSCFIPFWVQMELDAMPIRIMKWSSHMYSFFFLCSPIMEDRESFMRWYKENREVRSNDSQFAKSISEMRKSDRRNCFAKLACVLGIKRPQYICL